MKNCRILLPAMLFALAAIFAGCPKPPAAPEQPWGPVSTTRNIPVACSTRMADLGSGEVEFQFDWGDGDTSEWSAPRPGGTAYGDTHSYVLTGLFEVKARARVGGRAGDWSESYFLQVIPGEGEVFNRFAFSNPEDREDSADFSASTFALGPDGRSYIGCDYAMLFRKPDGVRDNEFYTADFDMFLSAPSLHDNELLYIACDDRMLYAFNTNGTRRWARDLGDEALATPALGSNGTVFIQTVNDSLYAYSPAGERLWSFRSTGSSSPVIGADGTVYACGEDGIINAVDPGTGALRNSYFVGSNAIVGSPALDPGRNRLYVADEAGKLVALNLQSFTPDWDELVGDEPSSPVIGSDGTIYIGGGGKLSAVSPDGEVLWSFQPPLDGEVSTPAVSDQGLIYFLASGGRKKALRGFSTEFDVDSLYAVNLDGSRRWAVGLAEGDLSDLMSAPKVDSEGYVYVGNGYFAWIIRGLGGPAASPWPMFQRDGQNTGRAR